MKSKHSLAILTSAILVIAALFSSCGSSGYDSLSKSQSAMPAADIAVSTSAYYGDADFNGVGDEAAAYEDSISTGSDTSGTVNNDLSKRKIIKTASVNFETLDYDRFMSELSACIAKFGGYVQNEESYGESYSYRSNRSAYITARVPVDQYDSFMNDVCGIGNMTYKSEGTNDVTMTYVDIESHVRALETEYNTLLEILEKAESVEDVISIQSRISDVTYRIESYKSQLRQYDDLISYCTININISEVERERQNVREMTFGEKIASGLSDTFATIAKDASDFAVWFVVSLPYIIIWAVLIAIVIILVRIIIKRSRIRRMEKIMRQHNDRISQTETEKKDKMDN